MERHLYHQQETMSPEQFLTIHPTQSTNSVRPIRAEVINNGVVDDVDAIITISTAKRSENILQRNRVEENTKITTATSAAASSKSIEATSSKIIESVPIRKSILNSNYRYHPPDVETALSSMLWTPYERTPTDTSSSSDEDEQQPQNKYNTTNIKNKFITKTIPSEYTLNNYQQQQQQQQFIRKSKSCHDASLLFSSNLSTTRTELGQENLNFFYNNQNYHLPTETIEFDCNNQHQQQQQQLFTIGTSAGIQSSQQINTTLNYHNVPSIYNRNTTQATSATTNNIMKPIIFDSIQKKFSNICNNSNNNNNNNNNNINNNNLLINNTDNNNQTITVNNPSSNRFSYPCYGYIPSIAQKLQQNQQNIKREPPSYESLYKSNTIQQTTTATATAVAAAKVEILNENNNHQNNEQITTSTIPDDNNCGNEIDNSNNSNSTTSNSGLTVLFGKRKPVIIGNLITQTLSAAKKRNKNNRNRQEARHQQQQQPQQQPKVQQSNCDNSNNALPPDTTRTTAPTTTTTAIPTTSTTITSNRISETGMLRGQMVHSITADSFITHRHQNKQQQQHLQSLPIILQSNSKRSNTNDQQKQTTSNIDNLSSTSININNHQSNNVALNSIETPTTSNECEMDIASSINEQSIEMKNNFIENLNDENDYQNFKTNLMLNQKPKQLQQQQQQYQPVNVNELRKTSSRNVVLQQENNKCNENNINNINSIIYNENNSEIERDLYLQVSQQHLQQPELQFQLKTFNTTIQNPNSNYKKISGDSELPENYQNNKKIHGATTIQTTFSYNNDADDSHESQQKREYLKKQQLQNIYFENSNQIQQQQLPIEKNNPIKTNSELINKITKSNYNNSRNENTTLQPQLQLQKIQTAELLRSNNVEEVKLEKRKVSKPIHNNSNNFILNGNIDCNNILYENETNTSTDPTIPETTTTSTSIKTREIILSPEQYYMSVEESIIKNRGNISAVSTTTTTNVANNTLATPQVINDNNVICVERASQTDLTTVSTARDFITNGRNNVDLSRVSFSSLNLQEQQEQQNLEIDSVKSNRRNYLSIDTVRDFSSSLKILLNQSQLKERFFGKNKNQSFIGANNNNDNNSNSSSSTATSSTLYENDYVNNYYSSTQNSGLNYNSCNTNINNNKSYNCEDSNNTVISSISYLRSIEFQFGESNIGNLFHLNTNCNISGSDSSNSSSNSINNNNNSCSGSNNNNKNILNRNFINIKNYRSDISDEDDDESDDDDDEEFSDSDDDSIEIKNISIYQKRNWIVFNVNEDQKPNYLDKVSRELLDSTTMRLNIPASNPSSLSSLQSNVYDNGTNYHASGIANGFINTQQSTIGFSSSTGSTVTSDLRNRSVEQLQIDNVGVSSPTTLGLQVNQESSIALSAAKTTTSINNFNQNINNSTTSLFLPNISNNNSTLLAPSYNTSSNGAIQHANTTTSTTPLSTLASTEPSLTIQVNQTAGVNAIHNQNSGRGELLHQNQFTSSGYNNSILSSQTNLDQINNLKSNCSFTTINATNSIASTIAAGSSNITNSALNSGISVINCYNNNSNNNNNNISSSSSSVPNSISNINSINNLNKIINNNNSNSLCQINSICAISGSDNNNSYNGSGLNNGNINNNNNNQISKNSDVNIVQNHNILSNNLNLKNAITTTTASTSTSTTTNNDNNNVNNVIKKSITTNNSSTNTTILSHNNNNDNLNDLNKNNIINISHNINKSEINNSVLNNTNNNNTKTNQESINEQNGLINKNNQQHRSIQRTFTSTECQTDDIPLDNIILASAAVATTTTQSTTTTTPSRKKSSTGNRSNPNLNQNSNQQQPQQHHPSLNYVGSGSGMGNGVGNILGPSQTDALIAREQRRRERRERRRNTHMMHHPPPHMLQSPPNHPPPHPPPSMHYGPHMGPGGVGMPPGIVGPVPGNPNLIRPMLPDILHSHFPPPYGALSMPPPPHHPTSPPPPPPPHGPQQPPPHFNPGGPPGPPPQSMITTPIISAVPMAAASTVVNDGRFTIPLPVIRRSPSERSGKGCCGQWFAGPPLRALIAVVALGGVACALGGAALGATGLAGPPSSHLTAALLMIGVGVILVTVSGAAWRMTAPGGPPCLGLGSTVDLGRCGRRPCSRGGGAPHGLLYPEFQHRPPPPSYQASMQEYRLRLLLLDRDRQNGVVRGGSPPPTYRSHAGSLLRTPLSTNPRNGNGNGHIGTFSSIGGPGSEYSLPPSYRSRNITTNPTPSIPNSNTNTNTNLSKNNNNNNNKNNHNNTTSSSLNLPSIILNDSNDNNADSIESTLGANNNHNINNSNGNNNTHITSSLSLTNNGNILEFETPLSARTESSTDSPAPPTRKLISTTTTSTATSTSNNIIGKRDDNLKSTIIQQNDTTSILHTNKNDDLLNNNNNNKSGHSNIINSNNNNSINNNINNSNKNQINSSNELFNPSRILKNTQNKNFNSTNSINLNSSNDSNIALLRANNINNNNCNNNSNNNINNINNNSNNNNINNNSTTNNNGNIGRKELVTIVTISATMQQSELQQQQLQQQQQQQQDQNRMLNGGNNVVGGSGGNGTTLLNETSANLKTNNRNSNNCNNLMGNGNSNSNIGSNSNCNNNNNNNNNSNSNSNNKIVGNNLTLVNTQHNEMEILAHL